MGQVQELDTAVPVVQRDNVVSDAAAIIQVIERAAMNPNVDIDKMQRLLDMQERILARNARAAYASALSLMQPKLPSVERNGRITITDKNDRKSVIQSTPYALWEDINDAIRPCLAGYGFALSFRTGTTPEGKITVTGILSHAEGHQEETTIVLTHDATGSKNAVQAVGSSISYGKRYTAGLLLNITSRAPNEADDDGKAAGGPEMISEDQIIELRETLESFGRDEKRFCKALGIAKLSDLFAAKFVEAKGRLVAAGPRLP